LTIDPKYSYLQHYYNPIYSGYLTYSNKFMNWSYMLGLRAETFHRDITFTGKTLEYLYDTIMFYPSVHISRDFTGNQQLQISYSRRINRPVPWVLNTIPSYIDPRNEFIGNPYVKPEFTDAYELNYRKSFSKITVSTQTYFRHTKNNFGEKRTMVNGVTEHQLINSDTQDAAGVELGLDINLFKWWQINTGANIYHYVLKTFIDTVLQTRNVNTWDGRFVSNFTLPWATRIQAVFYYRAPSIDVNGNSGGFYTTNLSVNQPLLKGKLNLSCSVQNVLNTIQFDYKVKGDNFDNTYNIHAEGPVCMFSVSYNFNNFKNKQRGRADDLNFKGGGSF
jgi:outer membrane receptor protein involved in Fe transport